MKNCPQLRFIQKFFACLGIHSFLRFLKHLFREGFALGCFFAAPSLALAEQSGDFTYTVSGTSATITSYTGAGGVVVIPALVNTVPVVAIGDEAFSRNASITSVTIPNGVTSIGNEAFFYCTSITSVMIPSSVTSIGNAVFLSCESLTSVTIPNSVTRMGFGAFKGCLNLASLTLSNSLTSIRDSTFGDCRALTSVTIPNSVTSIENSAFIYCRSLKSITIPDSATSIGNGAFSNCTSLTSVTIPNGVTSIADFAFDSCESLKSVTIPDSATRIGDDAFFSCKSLTRVTIPNSVTSIGDDAFGYCFNLRRVDFTGNAPTMGQDVFGETYVMLYRPRSASGFKGFPWTRFDLGFNDPPLPWMSKEIGSGQLTGYSIYKTPTYTVAGSGAFGSTRDKLRFSYQILSGDGEITAKVKFLEDTGSSSCVGLMIRDAFATNSKQVFVGLSGSGNYRWVQRTTKGGSSLTKNKASSPVPNTWLRLVRKGVDIQAYISVNGEKWTYVKSVKMSLGKNCYIGLAVASGSDTKLNTSQFSNVKLKP